MTTTTKANGTPSRKLAELLPGYLTIREAANEVGLSHTQMWRYIKDKILPAKSTVFGFAVREEDVKAFERTPKGAPVTKTKANPVKPSQSKVKPKKSKS